MRSMTQTWPISMVMGWISALVAPNTPHALRLHRNMTVSVKRFVMILMAMLTIVNDRVVYAGSVQ